MGKILGAELELIASDYVSFALVTLAVLQPNVVKPCYQFFSTVKEYNPYTVFQKRLDISSRSGQPCC